MKLPAGLFDVCQRNNAYRSNAAFSGACGADGDVLAGVTPHGRPENARPFPISRLSG